MYRTIQDPSCGQRKQLVLHQPLKEKILTSLHDDMGHQGLERTLHLIRDRCYWTRMNSDVEAWIKKCERCILSKQPLPRIIIIIIIIINCRFILRSFHGEMINCALQKYME